MNPNGSNGDSTESPPPPGSEAAPLKHKRFGSILKRKRTLVTVAVVLAVIGGTVAGWQIVIHHRAQHLTVTKTTKPAAKRTPAQVVFASLPACQAKAYLTLAPTDLSSFTAIPPLGAVNPGSGHVIPSDHFGFTLSTNSAGATLPATIVAPGDSTIFSVTKQSIIQNGQTNQDYSLTFGVCQNVGFYYNHLGTLSSALQNLISANANPHCQENKQPQLTDTTCYYGLSYKVKAGETLGTAGGPGTQIRGFDLGGYDTRTPELAFIDKTRHLASPYQYLHTICPLDYFSRAVSSKLYAKVQNTVKGTNGYPSCGTDMQDLPGTIQGNWYVHPPTDGIEDSGQQLAFIHNNQDPHIAELSYGGTVVSTAGELPFNPTNTGYVNRDPAQVKADGRDYCFHQDNFSLGSGVSAQSSGHFIVQLVDSMTLKIEFNNGACPTNPVFTNPTTYIR